MNRIREIFNIIIFNAVPQSMRICHLPIRGGDSTATFVKIPIFSSSSAVTESELERGMYFDLHGKCILDTIEFVVVVKLLGELHGGVRRRSN